MLHPPEDQVPEHPQFEPVTLRKPLTRAASSFYQIGRQTQNFGKIRNIQWAEEELIFLIDAMMHNDGVIICPSHLPLKALVSRKPSARTEARRSSVTVREPRVLTLFP